MVETRSGTSTEGDLPTMPEAVITSSTGEIIKFPPVDYFVQSPVTTKALDRQKQAILALNKLQENCSDEQWLQKQSLAQILQWKEMADSSYRRGATSCLDLSSMAYAESTKQREDEIGEAILFHFEQVTEKLSNREEAELQEQQRLESERVARREEEERLERENSTTALKDVLKIPSDEEPIEGGNEPVLGSFFGGKKMPPPPPPTVVEETINISVDDEFRVQTEPIRIPVFNGEKDNWIMFREQFLTFIHNRKRLPDSTKIQFLFTHLGERAIRVIKGITPVGANYERAWKVLNDRYNNDQILVNHHLKRFFNLPTLTKDDPFRLTGLVDGINELINSLPGINEPMKSWDSILIFCLFNKLDHASQEAWKQLCMQLEKPTLIQLINFLERRAQTNATANSTLLAASQRHEPQKRAFPVRRGAVYSATMASPVTRTNKCGVCGEEHPLYRCPKFRELSVKDRWLKAKKLHVCVKCLSHHDPKVKCNFERCPVCGQGHNRLLCYDDEKRRAEEAPLEKTIQRANVLHVTHDDETAILGTARIAVINSSVTDSWLRCLCDTGSQLNLITLDAVRRLRLVPTFAKILLNGVGGKNSEMSRGVVNLDISAHFGRVGRLNATFFVVPRITMPLPRQILPTDWRNSSNVGELADPDFHLPASIDALLGVNVWASIVQPGISRITENFIGQKTLFGWVLYGSLTAKQVSARKRAYVSATLTERPVVDEMSQLVRFWEEETIPKKKFRTVEEAQAEEFYLSSYYRTTNGRYGVRLPFKEVPTVLGNSRICAKRQFLSQERRLIDKSEAMDEYKKFMRDYISMGHMSLSQENDEGYYTPHHCVRTASKFRVVFNASCQTQTGLSLNSILLVGEKLQDDLADQLDNFRRYPVAQTADIAKMYRQIDVHPDDRKYQKIFWREKPSDPLLTYELNTVTYGQSCAPHCAVRSLQQCAKDYAEQFPMAAHQVSKCFYMDDYLGGADDFDSANKLRTEIEALLSKGQFELTKWCSNRKTASDNDPVKFAEGISCENEETTSILGLRWMPASDIFTFQVIPIEVRPAWTKREIASHVGKLYDPLGFAAPVVVAAKLLFQHIWLSGTEWDHPVTDEINDNWNKIIYILPQMNSIRIPRWNGLASTRKCELFGFCDASDIAYAAAVYMRIPCAPNELGEEYYTVLLRSKSRLAPLKTKLTVPRLELSAAVLLVELMEHEREIYRDQLADNGCSYWSDSRVALGWIDKEPALLKIFEASRVSTIRSKSNPQSWFYVPTYHNPADMATRMDNGFMGRLHLWLHGPPFIRQHRHKWRALGIFGASQPGNDELPIMELAEKRPNKGRLSPEAQDWLDDQEQAAFQIYQKSLQVSAPAALNDLFPSSPSQMFAKLTQASDDWGAEDWEQSVREQRAAQPTPTMEDLINEPPAPGNENLDLLADLACARGLVNVLTSPREPLTRTIARNGGQEHQVFELLEMYSNFDILVNVICYARRAFRNTRVIGPLLPEERESVIRHLIEDQQKIWLPKTIRALSSANPWVREPLYKDLSLFIDPTDRLVHLDGRVRNPDLAESFRNPIILPPESLLTRRILERAHHKVFHGGVQQILAYVRRNYWIPSARRVAKEIVHACTVCKRHAFRSSEQKMAPLPLSRTTPARAFTSTGVDYCGPVHIKVRPSRNRVVLKAYICVFVCLVTRAVHLELVSDMTTNAFIAALRRFVARRGRVKRLVSDHGTNFVGAQNELRRLREHLGELANYPFANEFDLKWRFNTERASHHGGIFEAAVKSAKKHLLRVIGNQTLTYEEYSTILTQVEACLNSRPIYPQSDDPDDLEPLTPAHFLIGEPLVVFPDRDLSEFRVSYLNRWELLQNMTRGFWKRWSSEYLATLLNRPKWNRERPNFAVGDLVIIKEDYMPPSRWKMGRITEVLLGDDGLVRSAVLKTAVGVARRPITKLALLERDVGGITSDEDDSENASAEGRSTTDSDESVNSIAQEIFVDPDLSE